MGLALDEPRNTDRTLDVDGVEFLLDESEHDEMMRRGGLRVDHRTGWWGSSFVVSPTYGAACG